MDEAEVADPVRASTCIRHAAVCVMTIVCHNETFSSSVLDVNKQAKYLGQKQNSLPKNTRVSFNFLIVWSQNCLLAYVRHLVVYLLHAGGIQA